MRRTAEAAAETRASLLEAGVGYFANHSFGDASMEAIASSLGITRGAVYHHFGSKRGFFAAVVESVMADLRDRIVSEAASAGNGWDGLRAGSDVFLEAAADETFRRIVLLDAPAVLGWDAWKAIDERTTASSLREGLAELRAQGALRTDDVDALAAGLSGAMNELALWVAAQPSPADALARARTVVHDFLDAGRGVSGGS
jgi:AcrR family transcriptional regulator